jgi:streptomycin 6-kinase
VSARDRLALLADGWRVSVDETFETETSLIGYGRRDGESVVLKVVKDREADDVSEEWYAGDVARAFGRRGMVRVLESTPGAALLERLEPGNSLVTMSVSGQDDEATLTIARLIRSMAPEQVPSRCPTVRDWERGFEWYMTGEDNRLDRSVVSRAHRVYSELARTQRATRLLHGDLQHSNILFDHRRRWVAIDPKGVIGEVEYEIGASLRNPRELSSAVADRNVVERRIDRFVAELGLDRARVTAWAFAQAVLSVIWSIQDGVAVGETDPSWCLARTLEV